MTGLLQSIEQLSLSTAIRESTYAYGGLLWLHLLALIVWGGAMFLTDLALLPTDLRRLKQLSFSALAVSGLLLFGAKAPEYAGNSWFWIKLGLLALLGLSGKLLRAGRPRLAGALSLVLWIAAIAAARGPATVKDIMASMVDPSGDFLFQSVQIVGDENGPREIVPRTDAEWQDVRARAAVLMDVERILSAPNLRAARPRNRSLNPQVENEPAETQALLDANRADFARRAHNLASAASVAMQAVDAKDKDALLRALEGIDRACEVCHLLYWYPKDQRAKDAAKASGILE